MKNVNTMGRGAWALVLACFVSAIVFGADSNRSALSELLKAEKDLANGQSVFAYRSYRELIEVVSKESSLLVAAWRGALLSCPSGDELQTLLAQLLANESSKTQRLALPVLKELRRTDERLDDWLIGAVERSDASVGVVLIELLGARKASDFLPRMVKGFDGFDDRVKSAIIEVFPRASGSGDFGFLMDLVFESEKWSELATKSLVAMNDPLVDSHLLENYFRDQTVSDRKRALAIDLLRKRGAVACKDEFYRSVARSERASRSAFIRSFRDWGESEDLTTILQLMEQFEAGNPRDELSRLFVSIAQTRVKDKTLALAALDNALSTADASLEATFTKMKKAIGRVSE